MQDNWMTPIILFLKEGWLLEDKSEAWKVQIRFSRFIIIDDVLYRWGHPYLYLRCTNPEESNYVLQEIYEGICSNHARARSLAGKLLKARYYWPTIQKDAFDLVKACDNCGHKGELPLSFCNGLGTIYIASSQRRIFWSYYQRYEFEFKVWFWEDVRHPKTQQI